MEAFSVETDLRGGPRAGSRARRLLRQKLGGRVPVGLLRDAALLVTELVANGVRHGGADDGTQLRLRLEVRPPALRVEVENPHDAPARVGIRRPDMRGGGGLGLHIVDRVASRWGVREHPHTAVWFELDFGSQALL